VLARRSLLILRTLASLPLAGVACSDTVVCDLSLHYGITVYVQDSVSGAFAASGARLVLRDGAYADSMEYPANRPDLDAGQLYGAPERPGLYSVTVRKPTYQDWMRTNVQVTQGTCHVHEVRLAARLQPS
jgi:hypothetical protein